MLRSFALVSLLTTAAAVAAQVPDTTQQAPAPVVRAYAAGQTQQANPGPANPSQANPSQANPGPWNNAPNPGSARAPIQRRGRRPEQDANQILDSQPIAGVWLRSRSDAALKTISATPHGTEIRLERGILNVNVHQPAPHSEILVDLPAGQTSLLKDGLYTFNADTNTVRVLHGEAAAYPGPITSSRATSERFIKVKESHQLAFSPTPAESASSSGSESTPASLSGANAAAAFHPQSVEAYPYELAADLLPAAPDTYANVSGPGYVYGDDGPFAYPYGYYAGGYPYGYAYPYGFYPYGIRIGFGYGYYGGFHGYGGGYRGGYGRGFRR